MLINIGNVTPLGSDVAHLAPKPVTEASEAFAVARDRYREVVTAMKAAEAAVPAAEREDRRAARDAELSGRPLPKLKTPEAQKALAEAQRQVEASENAARTRLVEYVSAVREAHSEIVTAARAELGNIAKASHDHLAQVESCLESSIATRRLLRELGDGSALSPGGIFKPSRDGKELRRDVLQGEARERLDALRELLGEEAA